MFLSHAIGGNTDDVFPDEQEISIGQPMRAHLPQPAKSTPNNALSSAAELAAERSARSAHVYAAQLTNATRPQSTATTSSATNNASNRRQARTGGAGQSTSTTRTSYFDAATSLFNSYLQMIETGERSGNRTTVGV